MPDLFLFFPFEEEPYLEIFVIAATTAAGTTLKPQEILVIITTIRITMMKNRMIKL